MKLTEHIYTKYVHVRVTQREKKIVRNFFDVVPVNGFLFSFYVFVKHNDNITFAIAIN